MPVLNCHRVGEGTILLYLIIPIVDTWVVFWYIYIYTYIYIWFFVNNHEQCMKSSVIFTIFPFQLKKNVIWLQWIRSRFVATPKNHILKTWNHLVSPGIGILVSQQIRHLILSLLSSIGESHGSSRESHGIPQERHPVILLVISHVARSHGPWCGTWQEWFDFRLKPDDWWWCSKVSESTFYPMRFPFWNMISYSRNIVSHSIRFVHILFL